MSSSSLFKIALACGFSLIISASAAHAEDSAIITKGAYFEMTAENKTADLELGVGFAVGKVLSIRPYARVPFSDAAKQQLRIDASSDAAKAGLGLDFFQDWTPNSGWLKSLAVGAELELGTKSYQFTPLETMTGQGERHQSFSSNAHARFALAGKHLQLAPQLALTYNRSYSGADAIGIVKPGDNGAPATVEMRVVDAPSVSPKLTVRFGTPFYDGRALGPVGFGAYLVAATSGAGASYKPWSEGRTLRGELWTYLFVQQPANARAGIALFAESSRPEMGAGSKTSYGLLVQLKLNTTLFEY